MGIKITNEQVVRYLSKSDYKYRELPTSTIDKIVDDFDKDKIDFSKIQYFKFNGRRLAKFESAYNEIAFVNMVSDKINRLFDVKYPNRNAIMRNVFSTMMLLKDLKDFTLIRFDFKKYFSSVSTEYIFKQYIENSTLKREVKDKISEYAKTIPYCVPGISISNTFSELIAMEFDTEINRCFSKYGIVFYERYIDDGIIVIKNYLSRKEVLNIIRNSILKVYQKEKTRLNKTKLNLNPLKFQVINRRNISSSNEFNFLGYQFEFNSELEFKYGITKKKIKKFTKKIDKLVSLYHTDLTYMRHILKANSSRVVYYSSAIEKRRLWIQKGLIANYNELKYHLHELIPSTEGFLKNVYKDAFNKLGLIEPHYINSERYNLYCNLNKNKALIFDEKIGISKDQLTKELVEIGIVPATDSTYYSLTRNYLIKVKMGH